MANKSSKKNKSKLPGTPDADVLTIKHQQITVNAGKGNDKINVNKGSKHKIYGEAGKDTITIGTKAGSGMKVFGDDAKSKLTGNDTFNISGGKNNYFYGGKGVDTFNIKGGTGNFIYGSVGNDKFKITGGRSNQIYGDKGNDSITISGGKMNAKKVTRKYVYNNGYKYVSTSVMAGIFSGNDVDTITIKGGERNFVDAGAGNDKITTKNADYDTFNSISTSIFLTTILSIIIPCLINTLFIITLNHKKRTYLCSFIYFLLL